jgi:hypothetical protein
MGQRALRVGAEGPTCRGEPPLGSGAKCFSGQLSQSEQPQTRIRKTRKGGDLSPCSFQPCFLSMTADGASGRTSRLLLPVGEVVAMLIFLAVGAAVVCCALCGYGIYAAVRRSRERRTAHVQ